MGQPSLVRAQVVIIHRVMSPRPWYVILRAIFVPRCALVHQAAVLAEVREQRRACCAGGAYEARGGHWSGGTRGMQECTSRNLGRLYGATAASQLAHGRALTPSPQC